MEIMSNKYYIIRTGDFATDANKKLIYIFLSCCLCMHDYISSQNSEYFIVMIGSSVIWTFVELFLNVRKIRIIKPMKIQYYGQTTVLNKYLGICLQGIQEGGVVTIIGLYFGDRLYSFMYQCMYHILIAYMVINMVSKDSNLKILSKRQVNTSGSLLLMSSAALYNGIIIYYNPAHFYREMNMFASMTYISSIWTIVSYYKEFRKVEVHIQNLSGFHIKNSTWLDAFYVLSYDVFFEIGIAYLTFYNIFILPCSKFITT
jgi:hypothetical protein